MRGAVIPMMVGAILALPMTASAQSGGLSPKQLADAGWSCFNVPNLGVHCSPPGKDFPPTGPSSQLLYFFNTTDPQSDVPDFTGTESLMRSDIYNGQPCPTDPSGLWDFLGALGLDYFGCHRLHKGE
jgi:hypothetical protein